MCSRVIRDWLSEFKALPDSELNTYASTIRNNDDLILALYELLEDDLANEVVEPVCHQLFDFYRSPRIELRRFSLDFLPSLIQVYLTRACRREQKKCSSIEAFLLAVYNLEIVSEDGVPKIKSFTIPSLATASIFHEPSQVAALALTESALKHYELDDPTVINTGPHPPVEAANSQNRLHILSLLLSVYNADIVHLAPHSHQHLCKMASRLCKAGFENLEGGQDADSAYLNGSISSTSSCSPYHRGVHFRQDVRVPLSSNFLVELLNGVYYVMFNGQPVHGVAAVNDIHKRAALEMYFDVLLVTNAIQNSLWVNPSGQPEDGPMGIAVALSPRPVEPAFSKSAITNASFRTKKLPEDIPSGVEVIETDSNSTAAKTSKEGRRTSKSREDEKVREKPKVSKSQRKSRPSESDISDDKSQKKSPVLGAEGGVGRNLEKKEDIEVPGGDDELEASPPMYDEIIENDRVKQEAEKIRSGAKITKPLKSIMKKAVSRKDSDSKKSETEAEVKKRDTEVSNSPRHSDINNLPASSSINGDMTDPSMVTVSVAKDTALIMVDHVDCAAANQDPRLSLHGDSGQDQADVGGGQLLTTRTLVQDNSSNRSESPFELDTRL